MENKKIKEIKEHYEMILWRLKRKNITPPKEYNIILDLIEIIEENGK